MSDIECIMCFKLSIVHSDNDLKISSLYKQATCVQWLWIGELKAYPDQNKHFNGATCIGYGYAENDVYVFQEMTHLMDT